MSIGIITDRESVAGSLPIRGMASRACRLPPIPEGTTHNRHGHRAGALQHDRAAGPDMGRARPGRARSAVRSPARGIRPADLPAARVRRSGDPTSGRRADVDAQDGGARPAGTQARGGRHGARGRHRQRLPDGAAREQRHARDQCRDRPGLVGGGRAETQRGPAFHRSSSQWATGRAASARTGTTRSC